MTTKNPKTYTAPHAVYVDQRLYAAGEPFTTSAEKGDKWEVADAAEVAAIEAADKTSTIQISYEELSTSELRAVAAGKNVQTTVAGKALSKSKLITAIKAADEPAL